MPDIQPDSRPALPDVVGHPAFILPDPVGYPAFICRILDIRLDNLALPDIRPDSNKNYDKILVNSAKMY